MDYHELRKMNVAQLREVAKTAPGLTGGSQMNKQQLLKEVCRHLNVEMHDHHDVVGVDKAALKQQIRELKQQRDAALEARDRAALARARHQIHRAKGKLRRAMI